MKEMILISILFISASSAASERCEKWFAAHKFPSGPKCEDACLAIHSHSDEDYDCPDECRTLCKSGYAADSISALSEIYPGLSDAERKIAGREPLKTLRAYKLSWDAINLCKKLYVVADHNDESDACRHFVWANLLYHEFGKGFALEILNAHEEEPQPKSEREMDLFNNAAGIKSAAALDKNGRYSEEAILNEFSRQLEVNKLKVLKPKKKLGSKK